MGTSAHLLLEGPVELLSMACAEVARLEQLWSRFIPESDISRLNTANGEWVEVAPETIELLERSLEGWELTGGLFDPTVLPELIAAGYDRDFDEVLLEAGPAVGVAEASRERQAGKSVELDIVAGRARLPDGVMVDSGGIGKGLGADLVVEKLVSAGADAALMNLGGDLRSVGSVSPMWSVGIDNPFSPKGAPIAEVRLDSSALATTTSLVRRWWQEGKERHHLIDPRTGNSAESNVASVTVVANCGWRAEVLSKGCFIGGVDAGLKLLERYDATGLVVDVEGQIFCARGFEDLLISSLPARALDVSAVEKRATVRIPANFR